MEIKYIPREDIKDYLFTTDKDGKGPPTILHLKKPKADKDGNFVGTGREKYIDLPVLIEEMGMTGQNIPWDVFFSLCEQVLQHHEQNGEQCG